MEPRVTLVSTGPVAPDLITLRGSKAINEMMLAYAHEYGHVVRLKVGYPFVSGSASEEKEYLESCAEILARVNPAQPGIIVTGEVVAEHPRLFEDESQRMLSSSH